MLSNIRDEHPQMVKQAMDQVGPEWMQELGRIVSVDIEVDAARDFGLLGLRNYAFSVSHDHHPPQRRAEAMRQVFSLLEREFSKFFAPYRQQAVTLAVHNLTCLVPYINIYCIGTQGPALPDDYDEELIFGSLSLEILSFLQPSTRPKSVKALLIEARDDQERATALLEQMIRATASLMQLTAREVRGFRSICASHLHGLIMQLEEWTDSPEMFVADDEEDSSAPYSARTAGYDLMGVSGCLSIGAINAKATVAI